MPSARTAPAPRRRHSRSSPPSRRSSRHSGSGGQSSRGGSRRAAAQALRRRVRWDRIGRVGLLIVLCVVAGVYVQQALAYFGVRGQANRQKAIVQQLSRANTSLRAQQRSLGDPATILRDARALGMVRVGEHPYEVTGLPTH